ncbi:MAG TPA: class I SAM-dependent methyltransferase [Rhizomicrobium sp.]|nr:class I SAM-dependent methyltransferase [Rhizomicrobium sp.]
MPLFAAQFSTEEAQAQGEHYDTIADAYVRNLSYPHTQEYMDFLDQVLAEAVGRSSLGTAAEICCGRGESFVLFGDRMERGVGVDMSVSMLKSALRLHPGPHLTLVQGDATQLPLADNSFDSVFMLGGIHHINNRESLFREVSRILKPGGLFYFREPVDDFFLWRWLRAAIYRLSPALDHKTERPLRLAETIPQMEASGMRCRHWSTHGFLGFCLFMNSDVLLVNRLFRFVPGIRAMTRLSVRLDEKFTKLPAFRHSGLQVIGVAVKAPRTDSDTSDRAHTAPASAQGCS